MAITELILRADTSGAIKFINKVKPGIMFLKRENLVSDECLDIVLTSVVNKATEKIRIITGA